MKNKVLGAVIAIAFCLATAAQGAPADEFTAIREELQSLIHRVDRLEQENAALRTRNEDLQERLAKTAIPPDTEPATQPPNTADWPSRVTVKGDLRYRQQHTDDARVAAERDDHLLRARLSVEAKATDTMIVGVGLSTSESGNPRGANVRLDGAFSRKPLYIDLGYFDWTFAEGAHAVGGKMKPPFVRTGQSLFWDNDVNPEGLAVTYRRGPWFASGHGFWIDENVQYTSTPNATTDTTDTKMYGAQFGGRFVLGPGNLLVGAMYYDLAAVQGRRPFYNDSSNGNSLNATGGLLFDFQVIELMAEYNAKLASLPLQVWLDIAQNRVADLDTAIGVGVLLGKAVNPRTWEAGLAWQVIEKDALFAQHIDSDFGGGQSDSEGWILRAGYAPLKNWALNATYFMTQANVDVGNEYDFDRLMFDFNVRF